MLILWIDATNSIVYEWVKIAINRQGARGKEQGNRIRSERSGYFGSARYKDPARYEDIKGESKWQGEGPYFTYTLVAGG
jgi:hypothetical protein